MADNTHHTFMDGHTHNHVFVSSINLQSIMGLRWRKRTERIKVIYTPCLISIIPGGLRHV